MKLARERVSLHASLRAQRSNPESLRGKILDCFAAPAMTESTYPSLNSACKNSTTAFRDSAAVAGLPPTCGLSSTQVSL
ncbi:hypothetical protein FXB40_35635 [Bradyrhizobium rifense]|uniref:Uncharacterized protein n=1 Tax=Bradyrhizobium rifense TaxID=515499 RepID=A0A5D3KA99_9BRAD|nr:hypothetical protein FXB40_35635 [Bradyrhizobium rifense]